MVSGWLVCHQTRPQKNCHEEDRDEHSEEDGEDDLYAEGEGQEEDHEAEREEHERNEKKNAMRTAKKTTKCTSHLLLLNLLLIHWLEIQLWQQLNDLQNKHFAYFELYLLMYVNVRCNIKS